VAAVAVGSASPAVAGLCVPFCPAREDIPGLFEPIIVLSGDFDEEGSLDLAVVSQQIPGDITKGSVSIFLSDGAAGFVEHGSTVIGGSPQAAAIADFNGDQHADLVVANFLDKMLTLLLGDGDGGFPTVDTIPLPAEPTTVTAAKFTGDPIPDLLLVTAPTGIAGTVRVYQGAGDGTFTELTTASVSTDPRDIVVADFDDDGTPDLAVGHRSAQSVTILMGAGAGSLGPPSEIPLSASVNEIAVSDINNDLKLDLVAGGDTLASSVVPLLGDGTGGFTPLPGIPLGSGIPSVTSCDYDRDSNVDVIAARFAGDALSLLRGRGDGTFDAPEDLGANSRPRSVHSSDLNSDGFCDSVSSNQAAGSLSVFLADGFGSIGTPRFNVGTTPLGVSVGDLNGDLHPDIAASNRDSGDVSILFGNGDGGFTLVQTLAAGTNPGAIVMVDLSGDGARDLAVINQGIPGSGQAGDMDLYFGDGYGSFPFQTTLGVGKLPLDLIAPDLNDDGIGDLVIANSDSDNVTIYLSEGGGDFDNGRSFRPGTQPRTLAALHVDDDGRKDVAVSLGGDNGVGFLMQNAQGAFSKHGQVLPGAGLIVDDLAAADINNDGRDDLLWINQNLINEPSTISIYLSDGVDWFIEAPASGLQTMTFAEALTTIDLDRRDGIDLMVTNRFNDSVRAFAGDGTGGFTYLGDYGSGREPFAVAVADLNRDSREDLVTADFSGDSVSVMLNNTFIDPGFKTVRAVDESAFTWDPVPGAATYNVYRGLTSILHDKDYGACLRTGSLSGFVDMDLPPSGQTFFYIVTPVANGVEGHMGVTAGCLKRINRHPCPL
jgi:hypothetical protein